MEAEDPSEKLVPIKKPLRHNTPTGYKIKFMIMAFGINNVPYPYRLLCRRERYLQEFVIRREFRRHSERLSLRFRCYILTLGPFSQISLALIPHT
jgi:hypothetical protein